MNEEKLYFRCPLLLPRKTQKINNYALKLLVEDGCEFLYINPNTIKWKIIHSDFETAIMNSFVYIYEEFRLQNKPSFCGCFFHFTSCIFKKFKNLVSFIFIINPKFIRMLYCLAFVPCHFVIEIYNHLKISKLLPGSIDNESFRLFLKYFEETWLMETGSNCISNWNVFNQFDNFTNNHVESMNRNFGLIFGSDCNLWEFMIKCIDLHMNKSIMEAIH